MCGINNINAYPHKALIKIYYDYQELTPSIQIFILKKL